MQQARLGLGLEISNIFFRDFPKPIHLIIDSFKNFWPVSV
jgi:hypothetical protein